MTTTRNRRPGRAAIAALGAALLVVVALLAGCGSDSSGGTAGKGSGDSSKFPRDVTVEGKKIHLKALPESIVVLSPSLTESVYAVGAGDQVKAVDKLSNYPKDAPVSDLDAFAPKAESIATFAPDLVLLTDDQDNIVEALAKLKITAVVLSAPKSLDEAYDQFKQIGQLTGHDTEGAALASKVKKSVDDAAASAPTKSKPLTYFWELDSTGYSVTSKTFIGSILSKFNLENIADKAPDTAGGYPQLSAEYVIDADPDLIFLADTKCCGQDAATVKARPGWDVTRAVKDDGIVSINDDIASRWGPRIADLAKEIGDAVKKHAG
ncbi:iron complex transport system substrate-binding protein [Antricoccus suffuscus]|uniref:Iron complex transport system substrate-binding protein n=1 Tax=Antricoccus suffuscus TaxID=1629062 RepID=A0A2T1A3R8_9ACTN|nr:helical backbone metal receptor [Antricoccus suffuscus]PRZ43184.1 iron complex transport system substrate-binding protein [Antricoccus suffuscus]